MTISLMDRLLVVIPARGGSKSIPLKNIQPLGGKPLIQYAIEYALRTVPANSVFVSTDSSRIAEVANSCGASVPFLRPEYLATDEATDYGFMRHALDKLDPNGENFDYFALLRPTSPMRPAGLLEKAISILKNNPAASSVRTVARCKEHPYRMWVDGPEGSMKSFMNALEGEPFNQPRQQLPEIWFQTGDLEMVTRGTLLHESVSGSHIMPLEIAHEEMIDIDSWRDFASAEKAVKL